MGLLRSNHSSSGGLENVLGNADAIFMNQNSSVEASIDNEKNLIPMKNSNSSFKFNIMGSRSRSNKKNNGLLETVDVADLKYLAEKEEHTMFSEQSSV